MTDKVYYDNIICPRENGLRVGTKCRLLIFYKCCLFLCIFFFFFPIEFSFLPISCSRIIQILGFVAFVLSLTHGRLNKNVAKFCLIGGTLFCSGLVATSVVNNVDDYSFATLTGLYVIVDLFSSFLIILLVSKIYGKVSIYIIIEWLIIITIFHAGVSFLFYLAPNIYDSYLNITVDGSLQEKYTATSAFRLMGLSPKVQYANAATHYGIVLWGAILLYKNPGSFFHTHKLWTCVVITLFTIAGLFSGRTFFVMIPLSVIYLYFLTEGKHRIYRTIIDACSLFLPVIILVVIAVSYMFATNPDAIDWAFEMFINMSNGEIATASTDDLKTMWQVVPNNTRTWLLGDGMAQQENGSFYMEIDAGYLRSIFYWGLFGSVLYYFSNYKYYKIISRLVNKKDIRAFCMMILIWFYIYNLKEYWVPLPYFSLLLTALTYRPKTKQNENQRI